MVRPSLHEMPAGMSGTDGAWDPPRPRWTDHGALTDAAAARAGARARSFAGAGQRRRREVEGGIDAFGPSPPPPPPPPPPPAPRAATGSVGGFRFEFLGRRYSLPPGLPGGLRRPLAPPARRDRGSRAAQNRPARRRRPSPADCLSIEELSAPPPLSPIFLKSVSPCVAPPALGRGCWMPLGKSNGAAKPFLAPPEVHCCVADALARIAENWLILLTVIFKGVGFFN